MRPLIVVASLAVVVLASGCSSRTETTTTTTSDKAATTAGNPAAPAMTFSWDNASNCVRYEPGSLTVKAGGSVNFNNSASETVWVTAPAGCFSAAETTFAVVRGPSPSVQAYQVGSYVLTTRPPACAPSGGPGPAVVVDSGVEGGK
jgi:plastocyanin